MRPVCSRSSAPTAPASKASAATRSASARSPTRTSTHAKAAAALLLVGFGISGCYLSHLAAGQLRVLRARQPIDALLADPDTAPALRERLALVPRVRAFAAGLGLEVGRQYTSFVPWPGDRVVTIVVATRPGEVEPAGFRFPLVGRVPYKGFFDPDGAAAEAARLRAEGRDVCEVGVGAYSTLGWLDDPVTGPMVRLEEGDFLDTLIHELVHATFYAPDQAPFNEGVASFVGEEGSVRFYALAGQEDKARARRERVDDRRRVRAEISRLRGEVEALYAETAAGPERLEQRRALGERARERIAALPLLRGDPAQAAAAARLNDACLGLSGTYAGDLGRYAALLEASGGDLREFVARAVRAAEADDPRAALLGASAGAL